MAHNPSLHDLARRQLALQSSTTVPSEYTSELRAHIAVAPNDTNFCLQATPGFGYGVVSCLENFCARNNAQIRLTRNTKLYDGGKSLGIGALSEYRIHCASDQHSRSRQNRLKELQSQTRPAFTTSSHHRPTASASPSSRAMQNTHSAAYKRAYDFLHGPGAEPSSSASTSPKRIKTESHPSTPAPPNPPQVSRQELLEMDSLRDEIESLKESMAVIQQLIRDIENNAIGGPETITVEDRLDMEQYVRDLEGYELRWASCEEKLAQIEKKISNRRVPAASSSASAMDHTPQTSTTAMRQPRVLPGSWPSGSTHASVPAPGSNFLYSLQATLQDPTSTQASTRQSMDIPGSWPSSSPYVPPPAQGASTSTTRQTRVLPSSWASPYATSHTSTSSRGTSSIGRANTMPAIGTSSSTAYHVENGHMTPYDMDDPAQNQMPFVNSHWQPPQPKIKSEEFLDFIVSSSKSKDFASSTLRDAMRTLGIRDLNDHFPGMATALHPHQVLGVAWMVEREKSEEHKIKGGMLADEMGLGKTVQMTTLIVSRPSSNKRPTLVIVPLNIMTQWRQELVQKSNEGLKCAIYHGTKRKQFKTPDDFKEYDVVLTTYQTMSREWSAEDKKFGLLFKARWHRIVLDESQMIRTKETITSRAVASLKGTYRWCLTGTPIINCLEDLFPFFRFIGLQPFCDYSVYRSKISAMEKTDPQQATQRLQAVLSDFLLRRKKDSMLNGKRLIDLPKKNVDLVSLKFSVKEREIYDMFERRAQGIMRGFIKSQTVGKNTNNMLVELLRLRQMCTHPALVKEFDDEELEAMESDRDGKGKDKAATRESELARARKMMGDQFVKKMQDKLLREELEAVNGDMEAPDATSLNEEECPICFDVFTDAVVTGCGHSFCRECIMTVLTSPARAADGLRADERPCPACRSTISPKILFPRSIFRLAQKEKHGLAGDDAAMLDVEELMPIYTPSTKMTWMLEKIRELVTTKPLEKVLIISQWVECLALVAGYLDNQGIAYAKYQGGMNQKKREEALAEFNRAGSARILLLSMKAGGVGLNLTRANNIVSLDLGWSRAVEEQAFDRVHRMTQEREVYVSRLVIENTVEDRILRLQERKQSLADGSLGEGAGNKRIKKLSVEDWANLFGLDARGNRLA